MILDIDPDSGAVELVEVDILTRFHVAVRLRREGDLDGVDEAVRVAGAGRVAGPEVLVSIAWARARGSLSAPPGWGRQFDEMVEFSAGRGWVEERKADAGETASGAAASVPSLRVHCEWPAEPKFTVLGFTRTAHRESRLRAGFERYTAPGLRAWGGRGRNPLQGRDAVLSATEQRQLPGTRYEVNHLLADGEKVAVHATRTLAGEPAGNAIVDLYRVRDGLIVEWWRVDSAP